MLYKKFNIPKEDFHLEWGEKMLQQVLGGTDKNELVCSFKCQAVSDSSRLSFWYYLLGDSNNVKQHAIRTIDYLKEYFFGRWRQETPTDKGTIDPDWWKRVSLWDDYYRTTIMWASCLGQWDQIQDVSAYPEEKCLKPGVPGNEELVYYLVLASVIRGESWESLDKYRKQIETGKKKREKLLLKLLEQIVRRNVEGFHKELQPYLKYYKKYEFPKSHTEKLAIDATFLINYARHRGLHVEYPPEYEDHIVKLD